MEKKYLISEMGSSDMEYGCGDTDAKIRVGGDVRRSDVHTLRSRMNKGFTLVELIVVIVILAILAAILVPALLGYIDKAKNAQYVLYAKNAMTATQTTLAEMYAKGVPGYYIIGENSTVTCTNEYLEEVRELTDDTGLNDAYLWIRIKNCGEPDSYWTCTHRTAYVINTACYIYQIKNGGNYNILFYDGNSWSEGGEYSAYDDAKQQTWNLLKTKISSGWNLSIKNIQ